MNTFQVFLTNHDLLPFHLSVFLLLVISFTETIGFLFGVRPLSFLKNCIPLSLQTPILKVKFSKILILIFFLINFSFAGYFLQLLFYAYHDDFAPITYLIIPTFLIAIFFTIFMVHCLDQVIRPKYYYRSLNLVGRLAIVIDQSIKPEKVGQARIRDEYGKLHYVNVIAESGEIKANTSIILIELQGQHYVAKKVVAPNHLFDYDIFPECKN